MNKLLRTSTGIDFLLSVGAAFGSVESSVQSAIRACQVFDQMGVLSEKCKVSGWDFSIELSMDMSGSQAIEICKGAAENMRRVGLPFDPQWQLKIYSPFSNRQTLAACPLSK